MPKGVRKMKFNANKFSDLIPEIGLGIVEQITIVKIETHHLDDRFNLLPPSRCTGGNAEGSP